MDHALGCSRARCRRLPLGDRDLRHPGRHRARRVASRGRLDQASIEAASAVGGLIMLGVGLRVLDIKQVRVVNLLRALLLAPAFVRVADFVRAAAGG